MKQTATLSRPADTTLSLLWCVLGLLVPRATLFGELTPFGVGLAAGRAAANLPTLLCLAVGTLLATPTDPLRYLAAIALVGGIRWVLAVVPEWRRLPFLPPLIGFVACCGTGFFVLGRTGFDLYRGLLILAESVVAAGAALAFDTAMGLEGHRDTALSSAQQAGVILTGAVAVSAATTLEVGGFAPGRVAAAFLVLVLARSGRESGGSMAGCILGGAVALSTPELTPLAIALCFGGLVAGLFSRFGRVAQAALFLLAAGVVTLGETDADMLIYLYELFAACVLFALLPREWDRRLCRLFIRSRDLPAVEGLRRMTALRLTVAANAMEEVSRSVDTVAKRLARQDANPAEWLCVGCRSGCEPCPLHQLCWEQHAAEMQAALGGLVPLLQDKGQVTSTDLTGYPAAHCRHRDRLAAQVTKTFGEYVASESAWHRLQEIQQAVEGQFAGTGSLLKGLAARLEDRTAVDMELSARVLAVCEDHGLTVQEALCTRDLGNRLTVDILTGDATIPTRGRWLTRVEQVCGRCFGPPSQSDWGEQTRVTLTEPPRYRVEMGLSQHRSPGESLCGDAVQTVDLSGVFVAVLADGMGSGGRAAVDGAMTAGITARLWEAGFAPTAILQTVNAALLVKSREESLATLDVAAIDTHTGQFDSYKAGAAATLLYSQGRISRLDKPGLPVGILPRAGFEHVRDTLADGDVLLMVSDGALPRGLDPVEELLRQKAAEGMQALADAVTAAAREGRQDHPDDVTALALRLYRPTEEE